MYLQCFFVTAREDTVYWHPTHAADIYQSVWTVVIYALYSYLCTKPADFTIHKALFGHLGCDKF